VAYSLRITFIAMHVQVAAPGRVFQKPDVISDVNDDVLVEPLRQAPRSDRHRQQRDSRSSIIQQEHQPASPDNCGDESIVIMSLSICSGLVVHVFLNLKFLPAPTIHLRRSIDCNFLQQRLHSVYGTVVIFEKSLFLSD